MAKNCARCNKTVYAIEELKCLEKIWHKTCFKCTECGMMLNMKTYKGFDRWPYCEAHIPKAKATTIAETPELKRIAENTKIQSNVKYHAEFEKTKGKLTQVADDPETLRIRQNTKNISNAAYHGEYLKKEKMERQRELADVVENKDLHESEYFSEQLAAENISDYRPAKKYDHYEDEPPQQPPPQVMQHQQQRREPIKKSPIEELRPMNVPAQAHSNNMQHQSIPASNNHTQAYRQAEMPINKNSNANNMRELAYQQQKQHHQQQLLMQQQQQLLYQRELAQQQQQMLDSRNLSKSAQYQRSDGTNNYMSNSIDHSMNHRNNLQSQNDNYAEMLQQKYMHQQQLQQQQQQAYHQANHGVYQQQQAPKQQQPPQQQQQVGKVRVYRALYDYEAQDSDEVSFFEGDMIVEMNEIDSGWLTGRVERTGLVGLVPANYLEIQNI